MQYIVKEHGVITVLTFNVGFCNVLSNVAAVINQNHAMTL